MLSRVSVGALWIVSLGLGGCASHLAQRGQDLYAERRYVEAAEVFERTEDRLPAASAREQAEYALYRGATFLALGDLPHAEQWLQVALKEQQTRPDALGDDQRVFLKRAWTALDASLKAQPAPNAAPPGPALASSNLNAAPDAAPAPQ
jgi:tetratricopeptide (TPR) repeat protein